MGNKALILDGRTVDAVVADQLIGIAEDWLAQREWQSTTRTLRALQIAPCIGCFGCWVKTPGECVIDDAGRDVARDIVGSDLVIYLTPIMFGGYSYELKKVVDRSIPIISPYFRIVHGETHHKKRYDAYPSVAAFAWSEGAQDGEEREVFETLVKRNAINMLAPRTSVGFVDSEDPQDLQDLVARNLGMVVGS
ncbi:flavodoxin family protein [Candidatus Bipolaricaulota bacterium]|nr:flavodoxin family protein [Candidatus Bipolaricaulota bacterium]